MVLCRDRSTHLHTYIDSTLRLDTYLGQSLRLDRMEHILHWTCEHLFIVDGRRLRRGILRVVAVRKRRRCIGRGWRWFFSSGCQSPTQNHHPRRDVHSSSSSQPQRSVRRRFCGNRPPSGWDKVRVPSRPRQPRVLFPRWQTQL